MVLEVWLGLRGFGGLLPYCETILQPARQSLTVKGTALHGLLVQEVRLFVSFSWGHL